MPLIKQILILAMRSRDASQKQVLEFNILPVHSHNPKVTDSNVPEKATKPRIHIRNDRIDMHDCSLLNLNKLKLIRPHSAADRIGRLLVGGGFAFSMMKNGIVDGSYEQTHKEKIDYEKANMRKLNLT
ncbi:hypothetical protein Tco_0004031 [Tanacetum coccineum]